MLVNALVHRDYLIEAPIRLFVFSDRIEIISPGHLPNHLTVEKIRAGNSNIRNPILASFVAKGMLPYHGIGSGIKRALAGWPDISFSDDRDGCLFTASIRRKSDENSLNAIPKASGKRRESVGKTAGKTTQETAQETAQETTQERIIRLMKLKPSITRRELSQTIRLTDDGIKYHLNQLRREGRIRHIGPTKSGQWEVLK